MIEMGTKPEVKPNPILEQLDELIRSLEEYRNEVKWAEKADKEIPQNVPAEHHEEWRQRCEVAKQRLVELEKEVKEKAKALQLL